MFIAKPNIKVNYDQSLNSDHFSFTQTKKNCINHVIKELKLIFKLITLFVTNSIFK